MTIKSNFLGLSNKLVLSMAVVALSAFTLPAHAAKFGVRVVNDSGIPVAGAAVCIGMHGNYKQFGALFTDADGQAMVDVPNVPLLVTVSTDRFTGLRQTEPARSFNLIKQVKLKTGVPGPRCRAGSVIAENAPSASIVVTNVEVAQGAYSMTISPTVSGDPTHYRVSANKDFDDTQWQKFSTDIALGDSLAESEKVFLQMRKRTGGSNSWLEARSNVLTIRLTQ